ncbi:hypothetical protein H6G17_32045 [Chroococcidiopsis sp. FACHB-1243]|uniref:hypothetical protein n=1 Tax=Chroococcidiopsis sp. [FACHB-1243] TaxID=2692781 RepID=UPI0017867C35|nr:hypothetical protein [Chroococcidiopsis sp. [FACHB-1243]]MBD2310026.1 hypothetical protein [Chroococcidiopsis sp. [FACHB-1243]]
MPHLGKLCKTSFNVIKNPLLRAEPRSSGDRTAESREAEAAEAAEAAILTTDSG